MEYPSIISRARIALHSFAAKVENFLTNFSSSHHPEVEQVLPKDFDDQQRAQPQEVCRLKDLNNARWQLTTIRTRQVQCVRRVPTLLEERELLLKKLKNYNMSFPIFDENLYVYYERDAVGLEGLETSEPECSFVANEDIIPPAVVLKQLAIASESGQNYGSIKDMLSSPNNSLPSGAGASLGLSALKSFIHGKKGDMVIPDLHDDQVFSFFQSILNTEGLTPSRKIGCFMDIRSSSILLSRYVHGAPPESLVAKLAEIMGSFKSPHKMALFWCKVADQLRRLWMEGEYVPGIPVDGVPDLNCCLIYQKLQVINCCVSRKKRLQVATELLESLERKTGYHSDELDASKDDRPSHSAIYVRLKTGEHVLRLGATDVADNLLMLETGEPVYAPLTQEGPLLTEDLIRENEEFVLRTGSLGAGCSQLLSDMQAFKAANPGCVLEDFVRWHSPPDWTDADLNKGVDHNSRGKSPKGRLSSRMQKEGNLWRKLWESAKPVPAVRQAPLYDEDLAVEGILTSFENVSPSKLFGQLFLTLLGVGFVIAEAVLSTDDNLSRLFYDCREYVVAICESDSWSEKIGDLCQVYEAVETMVLRPEEYMRMLKQHEEGSTPRSPFRKLSLMFRGKNRSPTPRILTSNDQINNAEIREPLDRQIIPSLG